jgi:hypothetical protein
MLRAKRGDAPAPSGRPETSHRFRRRAAALLRNALKLDHVVIQPNRIAWMARWSVGLHAFEVML